MKLRTIAKIAITSCVVLMCAGFALYSFFRLSAADTRKDINLYEQVPSTAFAVFATDNIFDFLMEADELVYSENRQELCTSKLFPYLKAGAYALSAYTPHGISRQMSQVMVSFHEPDNEYSQVFYCKLGAGDRELLDNFVKECISPLYSPKTFVYKGEKILIYPMEDGEFLACFQTENLMALSFQKKLIENVIDTYKGGTSLADMPAFAETCNPKKSVSTATIHVRTKGMTEWTELDMRMKDNFIYLSGVVHDSDTCSLASHLRRQPSVCGFPGELLPSTTFCFSRQGVADWVSLLEDGDTQQQNDTLRMGATQERNREITRFLAEYAGSDLVTCLFQYGDTLQHVGAVLSLPVTETKELKSKLYAQSGNVVHFCYTPHKAYSVYRLPWSILFEQLADFTQPPAAHAYASFYDGRLLLASDEVGLFYYLRQLDKGEVFDDEMSHKVGMDYLSDSYRFMSMTELDRLFSCPESHPRYLPDFFLRNADFFQNFTIFVQFVCMDGVVCPTIVLKCKYV